MKKILITFLSLACIGTAFAGNLIFADGKFVMGDKHQIWYSDDNGKLNQANLPSGNAQILTMTHANGKFEAGADYGTIYYSTDGTNWEAGQGMYYGSHINVIYYDNTRKLYVAMGSYDHYWLWTSSDGINWNPWCSWSDGVGYINAVATNGSIRVAVGGNWYGYEIDDSMSSYIPFKLGHGNDFNDVTYANGTFVAVGSYATNIYSKDNGVYWHSANWLASNTIRKVKYVFGKFIAVGDNGMSYSASDGTSWATIPTPTQEKLKTLAVGNNIAIAGGDGSDIVYTRDGLNWNKSMVNGLSQGIARVISIINYNRNFYAFGKLVDGTPFLISSSDGVNWSVFAGFRAFYGILSINGHWNSISDDAGVVQQCNANNGVAGTCDLSANVQSDNLTFSSTDTQGNPVSLKVGLSSTVYGYGVVGFTIASCSTQGNLSSDLCSKVGVYANDASNVSIPAPELSNKTFDKEFTMMFPAGENSNSWSTISSNDCKFDSGGSLSSDNLANGGSLNFGGVSNTNQCHFSLTSPSADINFTLNFNPNTGDISNLNACSVTRPQGARCRADSFVINRGGKDYNAYLNLAVPQSTVIN